MVLVRHVLQSSRIVLRVIRVRVLSVPKVIAFIIRRVCLRLLMNADMLCFLIHRVLAHQDLRWLMGNVFCALKSAYGTVFCVTVLNVLDVSLVITFLAINRRFQHATLDARRATVQG